MGCAQSANPERGGPTSSASLALRDSWLRQTLASKSRFPGGIKLPVAELDLDGGRAAERNRDLERLFFTALLADPAVVLWAAYALRRRPGFFMLFFLPVLVVLFGPSLWVPIVFFPAVSVAVSAAGGGAGGSGAGSDAEPEPDPPDLYPSALDERGLVDLQWPAAADAPGAAGAAHGAAAVATEFPQLGSADVSAYPAYVPVATGGAAVAPVNVSFGDFLFGGFAPGTDLLFFTTPSPTFPITWMGPHVDVFPAVPSSSPSRALICAPPPIRAGGEHGRLGLAAVNEKAVALVYINILSATILALLFYSFGCDE